MRVLVVEHDGATRAILLSTLRARRHQVTACADAESAWAEIGPEAAAVPFDLAILDVALPGQDGIAFCRRFKRHAAGRHAVILAVTADERIESLEAALESGVHDYVVSPVDRRILTIRVAMAEQRSLANATSRYSREALRESESRFEAFMTNSPTAAFIKDAQGRFLYVNRRYLELFQIEESDRIGRSHFDAFPPDVAVEQQRTDTEVLASGTARETVERVPLPDGVHDWLTYKFPLHDNQGRPTLVAGLAIDITDRIRAERAEIAAGEALRRQKARLETVLRVAARLNSITDFRAVLDAVCVEVRSLLGVPAASVALLDTTTGALRLAASSGLPAEGEALLADVPEAVWTRVREDFRPVLEIEDFCHRVLPAERSAVERTGIRTCLAAMVRHENGLLGTVTAWTLGEVRQFTADERALLQGVADQAALAISNAQALEARLQTDLELRRSEERFRVALKNSPIFVSTQDRDLHHTWAYSSGKTRTIDEAVGCNNPDPAGVEKAQRMSALKRRVLETGVGERVEMEFQAPDDRMLYFDLTVEPLRELSGTIVGVTTAGVDITERRMAEIERKRLEEQMRNAQKLESLGVLAGGIAHDFNNLLVGILGNAGLALIDLPEDSPARQSVKDIETSAQRAAELTQQMLAYSGRGKFLVEPLNLTHIVREMTQLLGHVISRQAQLSLQLTDDVPAIVADATQLRQVVMNLITNGSDALEGQPGLVTVKTGTIQADRQMLSATYLNEELPAGEYVFLEVTDSGVGMDATTRARIFEPFFTTKFTGRGLGLAAVLGIVRGHKGALDVISQPGCGTTFRLFFPAAGAATEPAPTVGPPARWQGSGMVLLVDDEKAVRAVARRVLERCGFGVVEADTGDDALARCQEHDGRLCLVLLDLRMPGLSGEVTLGEIRRRWPSLPVVVSSGLVPEAGGRLSAVPFLAKPYRPSELVDIVRRLLEGETSEVRT